MMIRTKEAQEMTKEMEETSQGGRGTQAPDRTHGIRVQDLGSLNRIRGDGIPVRDLGLGIKDGVMEPRADLAARAPLHGPRAAQRATSLPSRLCCSPCWFKECNQFSLFPLPW